MITREELHAYSSTRVTSESSEYPTYYEAWDSSDCSGFNLDIQARFELNLQACCESNLRPKPKKQRRNDEVPQAL